MNVGQVLVVDMDGNAFKAVVRQFGELFGYSLYDLWSNVLVLKRAYHQRQVWEEMSNLSNSVPTW